MTVSWQAHKRGKYREETKMRKANREGRTDERKAKEELLSQILDAKIFWGERVKKLEEEESGRKNEEEECSTQPQHPREMCETAICPNPMASSKAQKPQSQIREAKKHMQRIL